MILVIILIILKLSSSYICYSYFEAQNLLSTFPSSNQIPVGAIKYKLRFDGRQYGDQGNDIDTVGGTQCQPIVGNKISVYRNDYNIQLVRNCTYIMVFDVSALGSYYYSVFYEYFFPYINPVMFRINGTLNSTGNCPYDFEFCSFPGLYHWGTEVNYVCNDTYCLQQFSPNHTLFSPSGCEFTIPNNVTRVNLLSSFVQGLDVNYCFSTMGLLCLVFNPACIVPVTGLNPLDIQSEVVSPETWILRTSTSGSRLCGATCYNNTNSGLTIKIINNLDCDAICSNMDSWECISYYDCMSICPGACLSRFNCYSEAQTCLNFTNCNSICYQSSSSIKVFSSSSASPVTVDYASCAEAISCCFLIMALLIIALYVFTTF